MSARKSDVIDVTVGRNVRLYRIAARLSQTDLGHKIGLSFQQIQKYETGSNRIGAGNLVRIANALKVQVAALFDDVPGQNKAVDRSLSKLLADPRAFRLAQAFAGISDAEMRLRIVELVERIGAQDN